MQLIRAELDRARRLRAEASDPRAQTALDAVVFALEWAIEDEGCASPAQRAALLRTGE